jgi:hypothetical protein
MNNRLVISFLGDDFSISSKKVKRARRIIRDFTKAIEDIKAEHKKFKVQED